MERKPLHDFSAGPLLLGVWCPPPAGDTAEETERRYTELNGAGFNLAWNIPPEALDACLKAGVLGLVHLPATRDTLNNTEACLSFIESMKDHPALLGFNIMDEPSASWFNKLADIHRAVEACLTDGRFAVCNLFPDYANTEQLSGTMPESVDREAWEAENLVDYQQHVDRYMAAVRPCLLSFDYYPLYRDHTDGSKFFKNLRVIADAAKRYDVPFHGFLQAISWNGHRNPTIDEYRWLAHSHFIFGAKSLSYFYYRAPYIDGGPEGFTSALINYDGSKTELYDNAKTVNAELTVMAKAFLGFSHRTFLCAGFSSSDLPAMGLFDAVLRFGGASLSSEGQAIAGCFERGGLDGYYVLNYSFAEKTKAALSFDRRRRYEIHGASGLAESGEAGGLTFDLGPGCAVFVVCE